VLINTSRLQKAPGTKLNYRTGSGSDLTDSSRLKLRFSSIKLSL
jgi:hypothetical protein